MDNFESPVECLTGLLVLPDVFDPVLTCNYEPLVVVYYCTSFSLKDAAVPVSPYLELLA